MDMKDVGVVILCFSGLLYFHNAFGESENSANMLDDTRNEMDSLKFLNERNERRLIQFQTQIKQCHAQYARLTEQIKMFAHIEKRLADLEYKVEASDNGNLETLETVVTSNASDNSLGENIINETRDAKEAIQKRNAGVKDKNELINTKERKWHIDKRIVPVTRAPTTHTRIAFTASMTDHATGLINQQIIPFDHSPTNEGQAFDTGTHTFTCPVNGLYYFASSLVAMPNQVMITELVKDGSMLALVFSKSGGGLNEYQQGFNSHVVVCNKGDRVWVRNFKHYGSAIIGGAFTTFTGLLVKEL